MYIHVYILKGRCIGYLRIPNVCIIKYLDVKLEPDFLFTSTTSSSSHRDPLWYYTHTTKGLIKTCAGVDPLLIFICSVSVTTTIRLGGGKLPYAVFAYYCNNNIRPHEKRGRVTWIILLLYRRPGDYSLRCTHQASPPRVTSRRFIYDHVFQKLPSVLCSPQNLNTAPYSTAWVVSLISTTPYTTIIIWQLRITPEGSLQLPLLRSRHQWSFECLPFCHSISIYTQSKYMFE